MSGSSTRPAPEHGFRFCQRCFHDGAVVKLAGGLCPHHGADVVLPEDDPRQQYYRRRRPHRAAYSALPEEEAS